MSAISSLNLLCCLNSILESCLQVVIHVIYLLTLSFNLYEEIFRNVFEIMHDCIDFSDVFLSLIDDLIHLVHIIKNFDLIVDHELLLLLILFVHRGPIDA